jgi:hypothetical protein
VYEAVRDALAEDLANLQAMPHQPLARSQLDRPPLQVDKELPGDDVEELVLAIVRVPVELTLDVGGVDPVVGNARHLVAEAPVCRREALGAAGRPLAYQPTSGPLSAPLNPPTR